jgi:tetratricopeptide (TPR) repeat protein
VENQLILGIALRRAQKFVDAEKALLRAKKISEGKSPDVLWNLALLYAHNLKKLSLAADELEAYLKLRPDHPDAPLLKKLIQRYRTEG